MYRHEQKYLINNIQMEILKNNLSAALYIDSNIKNSDGSYFIRSLYFDDYKDTSYFQVLDGISRREKYRIRYYNLDPSYITLEKKFKENNLGKKDKDLLTKENPEKYDLIKGCVESGTFVGSILGLAILAPQISHYTVHPIMRFFGLEKNKSNS